jgi:hypothetical protein
VLQGLLNKHPGKRLDWPDLLAHPFVVETPAEQTARQQAAAEASRIAQERRNWNSPGKTFGTQTTYPMRFDCSAYA